MWDSVARDNKTNHLLGYEDTRLRILESFTSAIKRPKHLSVKTKLKQNKKQKQDNDIMAYTKHLAESTLPYKKDPFSVVSIEDSAIDWSRSDKQKYMETRDVSHLVYFDGQSPTTFHLKLLTENILNAFLGQYFGKNGEMKYSAVCFREAFTHCVVKVDNFMASDGQNLGSITPTVNKTLPNGTTVKVWDDESMNKLFGLMPDLVQEIGQVALVRHFLASGTINKFNS